MVIIYFNVDLTEFSVYAKKEDLIYQFSDESRQLQANQYNEHKRINQPLDYRVTKCSTTELFVYTNELIVRFFYERSNQHKSESLAKHKVSVKFFSVLRKESGIPIKISLYYWSMFILNIYF